MAYRYSNTDLHDIVSTKKLHLKRRDVGPQDSEIGVTYDLPISSTDEIPSVLVIRPTFDITLPSQRTAVADQLGLTASEFDLFMECQVGKECALVGLLIRLFKIEADRLQREGTVIWAAVQHRFNAISSMLLDISSASPIWRTEETNVIQRIKTEFTKNFAPPELQPTLDAIDQIFSTI